MVLGFGEIVDQGARQDVDQLDLRVADDEPTGAADGDGHLERELDLRAAGCADLPDAGHCLLHR